jgi:hypothetical protein
MLLSIHAEQANVPAREQILAQDLSIVALNGSVLD